jgi:hypothetical protein
MTAAARVTGAPGVGGVADPGSVQHDHPVANGPAVPGYEQLSLDSVHHSPRWTDSGAQM